MSSFPFEMEYRTTDGRAFGWRCWAASWAEACRVAMVTNSQVCGVAVAEIDYDTGVRRDLMRVDPPDCPWWVRWWYRRWLWVHPSLR